MNTRNLQKLLNQVGDRLSETKHNWLILIEDLPIQSQITWQGDLPADEDALNIFIKKIEKSESHRKDFLGLKSSGKLELDNVIKSISSELNHLNKAWIVIFELKENIYLSGGSDKVSNEAVKQLLSKLIVILNHDKL